MTRQLKVNGQPVETGCFIDGHWGQYAPDRLAEICEGFGFHITPDHDPRVLRSCIDLIEEISENKSIDSSVMIGRLWELHTETIDYLTLMLNENTTQGWTWNWEDGELFLSLWVHENGYDEDGQPLPSVHDNETCSVCGQPDNVGDCDHNFPDVPTTAGERIETWLTGDPHA